MKIGIVSKFGAADGLCVRAEAVLKGLVELGHEIHVFTQSRGIDILPSEKIHRFPAVQLNPHFSIDAIDSIRMIAKESQNFDLDLLHLQMNSGSTEFFLPMVKESLPPLVLTFHLAYASGGSFYTTLFAIAWKLSLFVSKKYDSIILVDPSQKMPNMPTTSPLGSLIGVLTMWTNISFSRPTPRNFSSMSSGSPEAMILLSSVLYLSANSLGKKS